MRSWVQIPSLRPTKRELLSTKSSLFVYPSHRLCISSPHNVRCISSAPAGLDIITRQRASYLRLDDIQNCVLVICNFCEIDDIQCSALIPYCLLTDSIHGFAVIKLGVNQGSVWAFVFLQRRRAFYSLPSV